MKLGNLALTSSFLILFAGMVWVNTQLKAPYHEIDLTDKFRNYLSIDTDAYRILKVSGSNGYPIEIKQSQQEEIKVLRSRIPQVKHRISGDTLIVDFAGARVSPSSLINTITPAGIIISVSKPIEIMLTDTHNRISGFDQPRLDLQLNGSSYTELSDSHFSQFSIKARDASRIDFINNNSADSAHIELKGSSVGFLEGLSYHAIVPVMKDSSLIVLSKAALKELMQTQ